MFAELSSEYSDESSLDGLPSAPSPKKHKLSKDDQGSEPWDASCEPSAGGTSKGAEQGKGNTVKDAFKRSMKDLSTKTMAIERLLTKTGKLAPGEVFTADLQSAPPHMFKAFDRSSVVVDSSRVIRSSRLVRGEFLKFCILYQKHLKNKAMCGKKVAVKSNRSSIKGHNCTCILKEPLKLFVELIEDRLIVDGVPVTSRMPMLRSGMCKKMTFQHLMDYYSKANHLFHPQVNQWRMFDDVLTKCMDSDIPADKLYIKLPVDEKEKEIDLRKIKHPQMKALMQKISRPNPQKPGKSMVSVYSKILEGVITKEEYLDAIPNITAACRKELLVTFNPPEDVAKLKIPMSQAVKTGMILKPLNTVQLAYMTKPDFDPLCYPPFFSNSLNTLNLDTITDLKPRHTLGQDDEPNVLISKLQDAENILQMDRELDYIKILCGKT